jgi:hypothetical protein
MSYIVKFFTGAQTDNLGPSMKVCDTWADVEAIDGQILDVEIDERDSDQIEVKTNLLSGLPFVQAVGTPLCCDPSSETYHSM